MGKLFSTVEVWPIRPDKTPTLFRPGLGCTGVLWVRVSRVRSHVHSFLPAGPPPRAPAGAHPTVPVLRRWQAAWTCPWKCSLSCRQASGVYHWKGSDRQTDKWAHHPAKLRRLYHRAGK